MTNWLHGNNSSLHELASFSVPTLLLLRAARGSPFSVGLRTADGRAVFGNCRAWWGVQLPGENTTDWTPFYTPCNGSVDSQSQPCHASIPQVSLIWVSVLFLNKDFIPGRWLLVFCPQYSCMLLVGVTLPCMSTSVDFTPCWEVNTPSSYWCCSVHGSTDRRCRWRQFQKKGLITRVEHKRQTNNIDLQPCFRPRRC